MNCVYCGRQGEELCMACRLRKQRCPVRGCEEILDNRLDLQRHLEDTHFQKKGGVNE